MRFFVTLTVLGFILIASSAHSQRRGHPPSITVIDDAKVQAFVTIEARKILAVTKNRNKANDYRFYLAEHLEIEDRRLAGISVGNHIIYIRYKEARNAYLNPNHHWYLPLLRRILAHEIAHDILRHSNYDRSHLSAAQELAADRFGILLWNQLGWDCSLWVRVYELVKERGTTDTLYRTDLQLLQAKQLCPEAEDRKRREAKKRKNALKDELQEAELLKKQLKQLPPTNSEQQNIPQVATRHLAAQVPKNEISATIYSSESQRASYLESVNKRIIRNWNYPEKAKQNKEEGVVILVFTILQDGSLENIRVQRSSGFASLDKAAMGTIVSAVPFDSIPEQIGQTTMEVTFTFNYKLTETGMTLGDTKDSLPKVEPPKADPPPQKKASKKDSEEKLALAIKLQKVDDVEVLTFVENEAITILSVTRYTDNIDLYTFHLTKFKTPNATGLRVGNHVHYIDYQLAKTALTETLKKNRLRIYLAHQIAHDIAGHDVIDQIRTFGKAKTAGNTFGGLAASGVPFVSWAAAPFALGTGIYQIRLLHKWHETELEADRLGIKIWKDLGWDCSPWVRLFEERIDESVKEEDYFISKFESKRLRQRGDFCLAASERKDLEAKFQQWNWQIQDRREEEQYQASD